MDNLLLAFAIVIFLAVVLLFEGGFLLWNAKHGPEARRVQQRLRALSAGGYSADGGAAIKARLLRDAGSVDRMLLRVPRIARLDRIIVQSGLRLSVSTFFLLTGGLVLFGAVLWAFLDLVAWMLPLCLLLPAGLPLLHVQRARKKRLATLEQQLPDALDLMGRALRAGHAFSGSVQMVANEGPEPIAQEFRVVFDEFNYGVPMEDALMNLAARVPVTDLRFFVIAVSIHRETGGNLAELLDKLAGLIRARFKLLGTIRVLSTEGRVSGWILTILPFVLLAAINLINPKFMSVLWTDPAGITTIWVASTLMVVGIIWMWRIIKIRI